MKLYMLQILNLADDTEMGREWLEGITSYWREVIVDNIIDRVSDKFSTEEYYDALAWLETGGNELQVGSTIYRIVEFEELDEYDR